ncbi:MAG: hypothetical protein QXT26_07460 [Thermoproteota archaeon]
MSLKSNERRKLEAMGITTLEQIALMSRYDLGLGKERSDAVIQTAQNILMNKHVNGIQIYMNEKPRRIKIFTNRSDGLFEKILARALYAESYGCSIVKDVDGFTIIEGSQSFDGVLRHAELIKDILEARALQEDKKKGITIPHDEIIAFASKMRFDGFWKSLFEEIKGNEWMKIAITCSIFSSPYEPIHTLIVGEPASAKTMARDIIVQSISNVQVIGANSTAAGLVVNKSTGDLGALSFSDGKIVLIDEFDKIPTHDIEFTYELLSNGKCRVDSGRIHEDVVSHFSAIALANPINQTFKLGIRMMDQIGLSPGLMSRFALIVRSENISGDEFEDLVVRKMRMIGEKRFVKSFDQWVKLARMHQPSINCSDEALRRYSVKIRELVERYQATPLRRDARMADYARRLPMAIARSEFRDVNDNDLDKALEIFYGCLCSWD